MKKLTFMLSLFAMTIGLCVSAQAEESASVSNGRKRLSCELSYVSLTVFPYSKESVFGIGDSAATIGASRFNSPFFKQNGSFWLTSVVGGDDYLNVSIHASATEGERVEVKGVVRETKTNKVVLVPDVILTSASNFKVTLPLSSEVRQQMKTGTFDEFTYEDAFGANEEGFGWFNLECRVISK